MARNSVVYRARRAAHVVRNYKDWIRVLVAMRQGRTPSPIVLKDGVRFYSSGERVTLSIVDEIFFERAYSPEGFDIGTDDVVLDIGANIGVFSVYAALRTRNRVIAFEPFPTNYEFLCRNVRASSFQHVITNCVAVSDEVGTKELYLDGIHGEFHGGHKLFQDDSPAHPKKLVEVPTTTLQEIMCEHELDRVDFMKMDCEGSEGAILRATPVEYLQRISKIVMEFHDNFSELGHEGIQALLEGAGFGTTLSWDPSFPYGMIYAKRRLGANRSA